MTKMTPVARRGRPTKEQTARINDAITVAAVELFLEEGYSATAMETVAARAGVSKVTVYNRFPTKADLFAAVVADRVAAWSAEAGKRDAELPKTPLGRLEYHALVMLDSLSHPEIAAFSRLISTEQRRFPEVARIYRERAFGFEVDLLAKEIKAIAAEHGRRPGNARSVALALMQTLMGWASMQEMFEEPIAVGDRRKAVRRIVAILVGGVAAW